ncbi:MAG: LysR family transcriptional regulator [Deltaproteobacteria bacterium]|nr:LysR family transcriptional regulator [Deltaproteobacteria bacterium]
MNLNHLRVFRAVAERGSITGAARALGADKAQVSRVVRALEASLDVVLVTRSARTLALTPAGEGLLATVRGPLDALEGATAAVAERAKAPSGVVTLSTTPDLARVLVAPFVPAFRARFPDVSVRMRVGPEMETFADRTLDLALRAGKQTDPHLRVQKLGELAAGFFASPRYLAARGTPRRPEELEGHDTAWPDGGKRASFRGKGPPPPASVACDDFTVILEVAKAGGGVAVLPIHLAKLHVREGALVRLFPEVVLRNAPLFLVTRRERPLPARVEVFRAHLIESVPSLLV